MTQILQTVVPFAPGALIDLEAQFPADATGVDWEFAAVAGMVPLGKVDQRPGLVVVLKRVLNEDQHAVFLAAHSTENN